MEQPCKKQRCDEKLKAIQEADIPKVLDMSLGTTLEVKWFLQDEGDKEDKEVWWKCTLDEKQDCKHTFDDPSSGKKVQVSVYKVNYEALPPWYMEESTSSVCFLDNHQLYDIEYDGILLWREYGSDWEASEDDDGKTKFYEMSENLVEKVLENIITSYSKKIHSLPASIQFNIQDKVQDIRKVLVNKIAQTLEKKKSLDVDGVQQILQEMGQGL